MLSMKTKYALKALTGLAREYEKGPSHPMLISDLAEQERIPKKFLELILLELKNQGFLQSKKGKGGGYQLDRSPEVIKVGQVVRALEGTLAPLSCVSQTHYKACIECPDESTCGLKMVMKEVRDATAKILDGTSLADVVQRERTAGRRDDIMFHI